MNGWFRFVLPPGPYVVERYWTYTNVMVVAGQTINAQVLPSGSMYRGPCR